MNRQDDLDLFRALVRTAEEGRACALATVVHTRGSTPRKTGTKMLVAPSTGLVGTVGGGCGEGQVLDAAARVLAGGAPEMVRVDLTEDLLSWSPAVCGGVMEVFVEAVVPDRPRATAGPDAAGGDC